LQGTETVVTLRTCWMRTSRWAFGRCS
jgi:hypothetical protein